jgi:2-polyprenyl-6-methoxyphenol hydroxylase-like FAD-dependent oxidoreductase
MSQSAISHDQVLITGAGPTGLTLAIELLSRGVTCRVIDKRPGPALTSRSFTIQPRTAECFARGGYVDPFLAIGLRHKGLAFHFRGVNSPEYQDFTALDTPFPHILIVEQNDTEAALREQLARVGGTVEWNTELKSLTIAGDGRITTALHHTDSRGSGREEAHPDWLVGCDGAGSTVRTQAEVEYTGINYTGMRFRMMDVEVENPYPGSEEWIDYWIDRDYMLLTTALPSSYRVLISDMRNAPRAEAQPDPVAARAAFQPIVNSWLPAMKLGIPTWTTEFDIWRRIASSYRRGRILLAGDAAHIHSPAAGMGMNTCLQDAFNLAWKLAAVATGRAPETLLDTYQDERLPIAEQVGDASHMLHQIMMAHGDSIQTRLDIIRQPGFQYQAAARISGLTYHYRDVIAQPPGLTPLRGLTAGDRAPNTPITTATSVHDLLSHPDYTLLVLQRHPHSTVIADIAEATAPYHDLIRTAVITPPETGAYAPAGAYVAHTTQIFDLYGQRDDDTLCLVRPDGYIGLRCLASDQDALLTTLKTAMLP